MGLYVGVRVEEQRGGWRKAVSSILMGGVERGGGVGLVSEEGDICPQSWLLLLGGLFWLFVAWLTVFF